MNTWIFISLHLVGFSAASPNGYDASDTYPNDIILDANLDVIPPIREYGYPAETHTVITSDGYILEMHRIPYGRGQNENQFARRPPVLLIHGIISSSADWVIMGPSTGLGYVLADDGYDVWMGNTRGNYYSRRHNKLNPDGIFTKRIYWKFSWHEMGIYDLPAMIDYI